MITISVNTREAVIEETELITTNSVGIQVQFSFSSDWVGLSRTAVFRSGEDSEYYDVLLDDTNTCTIPWELLTDEFEGEPLFIGVFGESANDSVIAVPTIWVSAGAIKPGAHAGNAQGADPTLTQWSQIRSLAESAQASAESAQASATAAEGYAEHAPTIVSDYWYTWNGSAYESTGQKAKGEQGDPGDDGDDGISPGVEISEISGGHAVTITDRDHPNGQTFNVLDGEQGDPGEGFPTGGTAGQYLRKDSSTDYDASWATPDADEVTFSESGNYTSGTTGDSLKKAINALAPKYSSVSEYSIGRYVRYDGEVYKCITAIPSGGETWNSAHWSKSPLGSGIYNMMTNIATTYRPAKTYHVGDIVLAGDTLRRCKINMSQPDGDFVSAHWSYIGDLADLFNDMEHGLAYIENDTTASRGYAKGDYISWKGVLYKATDTIASGESFSSQSGGNLAKPTDGNGDECGALNDVKNTFDAISNATIPSRGGAKVNCNDVRETSIIRPTSGSSNCPSNITDGVLLTFVALSNVIVQIFVFYSGGMSARCCWYGTWNSWNSLG